MSSTLHVQALVKEDSDRHLTAIVSAGKLLNKAIYLHSHTRHETNDPPKDEHRESCQKARVIEVLDALSNHIIDPERISFMQPFLSCTSQGSFGDVLRGALIPFPDDTCPSKVPAETIPVAVKILRTGDNIPTSMLQRRLSREAHVLSRVTHKNIVQFLGYWFCEQTASAWLVYPWILHGDSRSYVRKETPPMALRLQLIIDAAEGLMHLHSLEPTIRHGDIKAANFLVNEKLRGELCDFGLASLLHDADFELLAIKSELPGTIRWCSPEVLDGVRGIEADVWAWGLLAWEILTGTIPYPSISRELQVVTRILKSNGGPDLDGGGSVPASLRSILDRCWKRDPRQRISMSKVLEELQHKVHIDNPSPRSKSCARETTYSPPSPKADETTPLLATPPAPNPVNARDTGPPGSSLPDRSCPPGRASFFHTLWESCCCCTPNAPKRIPRSTLGGADGVGDPEARGLSAMSAVSRSRAGQGTIPVKRAMNQSTQPNICDLMAKRARHHELALQANIHYPTTPSGHQNKLPRFSFREETLTGKPLPIPWESRVRDSGLPLQDSINPEALLDDQVERWKALAHSRINPIIGYTIVNGVPHLLTRWQENGNIRDLLKRQREHPSLSEKLAKLGQIAEGLAYLHCQEPPVIHSNLKMENVLIDRDGVPIITDIGIFNFFHEHQLATYGDWEDARRLAPELWVGGAFTTASDVYSFGCLSLEILTGKRLFPNLTSEVDVVHAITRGESLSLGEYPELEGDLQLWSFIEGLLHPDITERLSMEEALRQINGFMRARDFQESEVTTPECSSDDTTYDVRVSDEQDASIIEAEAAYSLPEARRAVRRFSDITVNVLGSAVEHSNTHPLLGRGPDISGHPRDTISSVWVDAPWDPGCGVKRGERSGGIQNAGFSGRDVCALNDEQMRPIFAAPSSETTLRSNDFLESPVDCSDICAPMTNLLLPPLDPGLRHPRLGLMSTLTQGDPRNPFYQDRLSNVGDILADIRGNTLHDIIGGCLPTQSGLARANDWDYLTCRFEAKLTSHLANDDHLSLTQIYQKGIAHAELTFLSACHTAEAVGSEVRIALLIDSNAAKEELSRCLAVVPPSKNKVLSMLLDEILAPGDLKAVRGLDFVVGKPIQVPPFLSKVLKKLLLKLPVVKNVPFALKIRVAGEVLLVEGLVQSRPASNSAKLGGTVSRQELLLAFWREDSVRTPERAPAGPQVRPSPEQWFVWESTLPSTSWQACLQWAPEDHPISENIVEIYNGEDFAGNTSVFQATSSDMGQHTLPATERAERMPCLTHSIYMSRLIPPQHIDSETTRSRNTRGHSIPSLSPQTSHLEEQPSSDRPPGIRRGVGDGGDAELGAQSARSTATLSNLGALAINPNKQKDHLIGSSSGAVDYWKILYNACSRKVKTTYLEDRNSKGGSVWTVTVMYQKDNGEILSWTKHASEKRAARDAAAMQALEALKIPISTGAYS